MSTLYDEKELLDVFGKIDVNLSERASYFINAVVTWQYRLSIKRGFSFPIKEKKRIGMFNVVQHGNEIVFKYEEDMLFFKIKYSEHII